jgi:hypothetical protein
VENAEYWRKRFDAIEAAKNKTGERTFADIDSMFRASQKELDEQIEQ